MRRNSEGRSDQAFLADSALAFVNCSCACRKFLQYSQFGSEQYGEPGFSDWCGTG
jgi:hypothetical protein